MVIFLISLLVFFLNTFTCSFLYLNLLGDFRDEKWLKLLKRVSLIPPIGLVAASIYFIVILVTFSFWTISDVWNQN
jgi:hypothetical protein